MKFYLKILKFLHSNEILKCINFGYFVQRFSILFGFDVDENELIPKWLPTCISSFIWNHHIHYYLFPFTQQLKVCMYRRNFSLYRTKALIVNYHFMSDNLDDKFIIVYKFFMLVF